MSLIQNRDAFAATHPELRQTINGREWGVLSAGTKGATIILLPGTLGRADIFWNQIEDLQDHARIIALTYPNSGSINEWCEDIAAIMSLDGIDKAVVLGSSLGGYVAQYFAASYPEKVSTLIAANTLPSAEIVINIPPYNGDLEGLPIDVLRQGFAKGMSDWAEYEPERKDLIDLLRQEFSGRIPEDELRQRLIALKSAPEINRRQNRKFGVVTVESLDDRLIPQPIRDALRDALSPDISYYFRHGSHFPYITFAKAYSAIVLNALGIDQSTNPWRGGTSI